MLGYIVAGAGGVADRCLADLARRLDTAGLPFAGAIQINTARADGQPDDMDLRIIGTGRLIRISQSLGRGSEGCRLNAAALEDAAGLVGATLDTGAPRVLLLNRFGRQEAEGRGFRPLIGRALGEGVAVLIAVGADYLDAFEAFAGGIEQRMPADPEALFDWCREATGAPVSPE
ncbi:DUF2478 domain-containing protein [Albidovulum sp.]|uniref:DUF2478 domain-containing protein n=1 Tax=Albidovulum sp. TaxID=1872424 RepID=UPI0039B8C494